MPRTPLDASDSKYGVGRDPSPFNYSSDQRGKSDRKIGMTNGIFYKTDFKGNIQTPQPLKRKGALLPKLNERAPSSMKKAPNKIRGPADDAHATIVDTYSSVRNK
jgi:hypothetical protein